MTWLLWVLPLGTFAVAGASAGEELVVVNGSVVNRSRKEFSDLFSGFGNGYREFKDIGSGKPQLIPHVWRPPPAVFCVFDCSAGVRPTWPGSCLAPTEVFSTTARSWLTLKTRAPDRVGITMAPLSVLWKALSAGDMTWEGWFKILEQTPNKSTSLMGTAGVRHNGDYYALDGGFSQLEDYTKGAGMTTTINPATRRRHAAVWIDNKGMLSVSTNVGRSTGLITGGNLTDFRWHHVAVVWQTAGGHKITFDFKVLHADVLRIWERAVLFQDLLDVIKQVVGDISKTRPEDCNVLTWDDSARYVGGWIRFGTSVQVNAPVGSSILDTEQRLGSRGAMQALLTEAIQGRIMQLPFGAYPIKPFNTPPIHVETASFTMPKVSETGSVHLYVDSIKQDGKITFDPRDDWIGMDDEFVIAGGYLGAVVNAEVQNFRLWSRALTVEEVATVGLCTLEAESLFGGPHPYDLYLNYVLNGDYTSAVVLPDHTGLTEALVDRGTSELTLTGPGGEFVRGGLCGYDACPESSDAGCPLVKNRIINFNTTEECESFARFNFCRIGGQERGRPPLPIFDGCHRGGGDEIAEIVLGV